MTQKNIQILAVSILVIVAGLILLLNRSQSSLHDELKKSTGDQLSNVYFYKDFMRDSEGLELPLTEDFDKLVSCIKSLERSGVSIKSLNILREAKIRLTFTGEKSRDLEFEVMEAEEYGDRAIITIGTLGALGSGNGGTYESDLFLPWLNALSTQEKYEVIWEY